MSNNILFCILKSGVRAAKKLGITTIAIPNEFTINQQFEEADIIIKNRAVLNFLSLKK